VLLAMNGSGRYTSLSAPYLIQFLHRLQSIIQKVA
jgi:hypothetical protein